MGRMFSNVRVSRSFLLVISLIAVGSVVWFHDPKQVEVYNNKEEIEIRYNQYVRGNTAFDVQAEMNKLNEEKVSQDDPRLIKIIRDYFIIPPSRESYNLTDPSKKDYSGQGKDFLLQSTVKGLPEKGFFIECGAYDGEFLSSSLYFEKEKHWNGLLIEANPYMFRKLLKKNRKAYTLNACLSTKPYPSVMQFNLLGAISRLVEGGYKESYKHHHNFAMIENIQNIQCFPLYSALLAMNQTRVDYFLLDTEGAEKGILETVPWPKTDIRVMLVEYSHQGTGVEPMQKYIESNGYKTLSVLQEDILVQKQ